MPLPLPGTAWDDCTNGDAAAAVAVAEAAEAGPLLVAAMTPTPSAAVAPSVRILRTISISLFELPESIMETVPATLARYLGTIRMSSNTQRLCVTPLVPWSAVPLARRSAARVSDTRLTHRTQFPDRGNRPGRRDR